MDKHGIPRRDQEQAQQPTGVHTDPEWLREKYHDEGMSMKQMAEVADCSPATIKTWMDKHDVQSRSFDHDRRTGPVVHEVLPAGYERVASKNGNGSFDSAYVHQLVAIAYGADPRAVFSGGDYHVHHRNHIPWDNRPENLELLTEQEHMNEHRG